MHRRKLIRQGLITAMGLSIAPKTYSAWNKPSEIVLKHDSPELINCYYYAPHNHTMLNMHIAYDLENMVSMGANTVSFCVQEDQLTNWHSKRVGNFIELAHKQGLKVHVVPNRWAGLLAGWLDGYSGWSLQNQDTWYKNEDYRKFAYSNPELPKVGNHYKEYLKILIEGYGIDGIIWDEPRPFKEHKVIEFLDDMSAYSKSLKKDIVISIFAEAGALNQAEWFCETKHMDYAGADGHLRSEDHKMHRMKNTIFTTHDHFYPILKAKNKNTFFLIEGQRHRDEDLDNYLENLEKAFSLPMEHLMYYYSAHEMSMKNGDIFNRETWKMIEKIATRKS